MNRIWEMAVTVFSWACGLLLLAGVVCVLGHLLMKGGGSLGTTLIFGDTRPWDALFLGKQVFDGLFPAMAGTFLLVILSVGLAVPMGICGGIYLAEYAPPGVRNILGLSFDVLAGIPSVVVGLSGFAGAVFLHRHFAGRVYPCLLVSAMSLAFLVLPYILRTTQLSLESIPARIRLAGPALGATRLQNILLVLVPNSLSGILSGVVLSVGRCAEDTAVIMLTGAVASAGVPGSLLSRYEALPFHIYYISSQYADHEELTRGYGASLILLMICMSLFALAFLIRKGAGRHPIRRA